MSFYEDMKSTALRFRACLIELEACINQYEKSLSHHLNGDPAPKMPDLEKIRAKINDRKRPQTSDTEPTGNFSSFDQLETRRVAGSETLPSD